MIDALILNRDGSISLIYTHRSPFTVNGTTLFESLKLASELLDWSAHFDMLDRAEEVTQIINLKEAV